jgi:transposase
MNMQGQCRKGIQRGQKVERFDERGTTRTCVCCNYVHKDGIDPKIRVFKCQRCSFALSRDHHSCLNIVKRLDSVLWQRLSGKLPDRSIRIGLHPFLFKPRNSNYTIAVS